MKNFLKYFGGKQSIKAKLSAIIPNHKAYNESPPEAGPVFPTQSLASRTGAEDNSKPNNEQCSKPK